MMTKRNEQTSARVAAVAAKGLRGPTLTESWEAFVEFQQHEMILDKRHSRTFYAGARWWHRKVKAALASALTQTRDKKSRGARKVK